MHVNSRLSAVLLLVTFVAAISGVQTFASEPMRHPAGCHAPMLSHPSLAPVSYQCCANGHDWAIPNAQFSFDRPVADVRLADVIDDSHLSSNWLSHFVEFDFPSNSPPGFAPLRI